MTWNSFRQTRLKDTGSTGVSKVRYHEQLDYKLSPYDFQKKAIDQATEGLLERGYHALLVDLGLGKTKMTIHIAEILHSMAKVTTLVVVCPKSLTLVWEAEIKKHATMPVDVLVWEATKARTKAWQSEYRRHKKSYSCLSVVVLNVESFQKPNELFIEVAKFYACGSSMIAVDESTYIKTPQAKRTKNVLKYGQSFGYRVILTGNEITNSPLDLYSQFEFLSKGFWGIDGFFRFKLRYADLMDIRLNEGRSFKKVIGYKNVDELLGKVDPVSFRAKKEECLDLPERIYAPAQVELSKEQRRVYEGLKEDLIAEYEGQVLTATDKVTLLLRFRQIVQGYMPETGVPIGTLNPKLEFLIADSQGYGGKVIVFENFIAALEGTVRGINRHYSKEVALGFYGATKDREEVLYRFENDPDIKYLVANPAVAGHGLNLQFATLQYWLSLPFRMDLVFQGEGRSHRSGTKSAVVYKRVSAIGTVDAHIEKVITRKQDVLSAFQSGNIDDLMAVL